VVIFVDRHPEHIKYAGKGIGLTNVIRRLEMIYPNQFVLSINENEEKYMIVLEIQLL